MYLVGLFLGIEVQVVDVNNDLVVYLVSKIFFDIILV